MSKRKSESRLYTKRSRIDIDQHVVKSVIEELVEFIECDEEIPEVVEVKDDKVKPNVEWRLIQRFSEWIFGNKISRKEKWRVMSVTTNTTSLSQWVYEIVETFRCAMKTMVTPARRRDRFLFKISAIGLTNPIVTPSMTVKEFEDEKFSRDVFMDLALKVAIEDIREFIVKVELFLCIQ